MKNTLIVGLPLAVALCWPNAAPAQQSEISLDVQVPMLVKVLTFDRKLSFRTGTELKVGIVYQSSYPESREVKDRAVQLFGDKEKDYALGGFSCNTMPIDVDGKTDIGTVIADNQVDMLFVAPLKGVDVRELARISNQERILSTTSVPDYVQDGIGVGIGRLGGRPRVLINLASARAAGADFSAGLLRMATVINEGAP